MIKREAIGLKQNGVIAEHVLYSDEESTNLVLFFPGGSSNTTVPMFYYLRDYFLRNGYDVLSLSYKGLTNEEESYDEQMNKLIDAAHQTIMHVKESKTYNKTLFASRSIGNAISCATRKKYKLEVDKCIYMSPTRHALDDMKQYPGLIITSNHDEYINEEQMKEILAYPDHEVLVFQDGDHSLECEDTLRNIDFCKEAISKAIEYINKK
jgi:hypothetical protein